MADGSKRQYEVQIPDELLKQLQELPSGVETALDRVEKEYGLKTTGSEINASGKHVRVIYTPYAPLLYSKTGVCRGIPIFLIFAPKHRLWVLVRTASARRF